ncbi:MAG: hypothetical protein A2266_04025 [Bacteroidetes bacterium RIFOXYA12_FULL_40_10]|nr:MAG: hypothetical protein A2266_04025 [Bacteroidetes bacterium RIFOXYA12_FULL_40_10]
MIPSLRIHKHCQVAQKADTQIKTCQRVWLPQHTVRQQRIKHQNTTHGIVHEGLRGLRSSSLAVKFLSVVKFAAPKSPTISYRQSVTAI